MVRFSRLISMLLIAILLISSCATLINGPKTKIQITAPEGTTVKLDGIELAPGTKEASVKSKKKHRLQMSKEGFKPVSHEIYATPKFTSLYNILGGFASIPFYANIGNNKDGGQMGRLFLANGVMVATPALMFVVDGLSGSNYKSYPTSFNYTLYKSPAQITAPKQLPIGCSDVNLRMKIGDKIGSNNFQGKEYSAINWENTVNVKVEEFEVIVNNGLKDLGFKVPKEIGQNGFLLNAEVTGIDIQSDQVAYGVSALVDCKLTTRWTLTDVASNQVALSRTIESVNLFRSLSLNNAILSSFENSFHQLLTDNPNIYELVAPKEVVADEPNTLMSEIVLNGPKTNAKVSLQEVTRSVVTIEMEEGGHGSGFLVSDDGYIVTNYHVVKSSKQVNVILAGGMSFIGDVIRSDRNSDIALLKLKGKGFKALKLSTEENAAALGSDVFAIGSPTAKELSQTVTKGIISGNRLVEGIPYIQSDVSVSPGSSGGPLLDKNGLVIGIITSKVTGKGVEGISFALPADKAIQVLKLRY